MRDVETVYAVPGWGAGVAWTQGSVLLAHDFRFAVEGAQHAVALRAAAHRGESSVDRGLREGTPGSAAPSLGAPGAGSDALSASWAPALQPTPSTLDATPSSLDATPSTLDATPSTLNPTPLEGAACPPTGTVPSDPSRMGNVSAPGLRRRRAVVRGPLPDELVERFVAYLGGSEVTFDDVEIDLTWATPFQRAVAEVLRSVPRGEVVTYGELAALAGFPGAARAAGSFCASSRFAFVVPCHRVISASGIGGYGAAGVLVKRRLLALEGVVV